MFFQCYVGSLDEFFIYNLIYGVVQEVEFEGIGDQWDVEGGVFYCDQGIFFFSCFLGV